MLSQAALPKYAKMLISLSFSDLKKPRKLKLIARAFPYTMVGYPRLSNAYEIAQQAEKDALPGAFVECGAGKGGSIGIMASVAKTADSNRNIWLFDSFEGLPEPTQTDGERAIQYASERSSGELRSIGKCEASVADAEELLFDVMGVSADRVFIVKGWFQETLLAASAQIGPIAILRLDADWYESTMCALENLYDLVVPGGYVIVDDYGHWEGCKMAMDEFLRDRGIAVSLLEIDYTGRFFQKPIELERTAA